MKDNTAMISHSGIKHSKNVKASLLASNLVVTEVDEDLLPRFKAQEVKTKCLSASFVMPLCCQ